MVIHTQLERKQTKFPVENKFFKMLKPKSDNNDKILKDLREIVSSGGNKQCFDCGQKGVTAIDMTIGSFICTTCSGIL